jgi:hypothetical protein
MKHLVAANYVTLLACAILYGFTGCAKFDPGEEIPAYLHIEDLPLIITNPGQEGSSSENITDAWVYVDGILIGAFELPCTFPVIAEGNHSVLVRAGVKQNGLSSLRAMYPFYQGWEQTVNLVKGTVTTITPDVHYFPAATFGFKESFDETGSYFSSSGNGGILVRDSLYGPFEGKSGHVQLNADTIEFLGLTGATYQLFANTEVWLELNYKSNESFTVGIMNQGVPYGAIQVNAHETWNKIYIRLNDAISESDALQGGNYFQVYIAMRRTEATVDLPTLFLDNIKLLK